MNKPLYVRKTFYIRQHNMWLVQAIKTVLRKADEIGIRCTDTDVIINALTEYLKDYKQSDVKEVVKTKPVVELKRTVTCPTEKGWLFARVDELVSIKRAAGVHTSFSYELCNLCISGLSGDIKYGTIQRDMLKSFKGKI